MQIGICVFTILLSNFTLFTNAEIPSTSRKLQIQLPIAFPIIKSECPFIEDVIVIKISGNDVPIATTVNPIIVSDKPNFFAILVADFNKKSAPFTSKTKPIIINIISNIKIVLSLIYYNYFLLYFKLIIKQDNYNTQ